MHAWIDGRSLPDATAAAVRVDDRGLTVGDGLFETLKVVDGSVVALTAHLQRLSRSMERLGLPPVDPAFLRSGIADVLAREHLRLGRLRITVTAGRDSRATGHGGSPTVLVTAAPMTPAAPAARVVTAPWPRNERGPLAGIKSTSYGDSVLALEHARGLGADEAVFANTRGELCEGTMTNVFYVVDGELRTPTLAAGCLPGITRALLLEWLGATEVDAPLADARRASEIFLTSRGRDVQPVARWDDRGFPAPGPVTGEAMRIWAEREPSVREAPEL